MSVDIATYVHDLAVEAKAASAALATASDEQRQEAVRAMAAALRNGVDSIVAANELDMSAARDMPAILMPLSPSLKYPAVRVTGLKNGMTGSVRLSAPNAAHQTNKTHVLRLNISCLKRYARYPVSMHTFSFQEGWS